MSAMNFTPPVETPDFDPLCLLMEDEHIVCVNKQAGELVVSDRWKKESNVLLHKLGNYLRQNGHRPDSTGRDLYAVHRLDRDTSGVVIFAKHSQAHRTLSRLFESREVNKTYWLFTRGVPTWQTLTVDVPLARIEGKRGRGRGKVDHEKGKPAQTQFRVLQRFGDIAWLEAKPVTGRLHQIRLHAIEAGIPLLFDPQYLRDAWQSARHGAIELDRVPLHANFISFRHPDNNAIIEIKAPVDAQLARLISQLTDESV